MKKSLTITIIMIFIIGIFGGIVNAASAGINANQKTVEVGNNVSVTISFSQKVSKAQFNINYDCIS